MLHRVDIVYPGSGAQFQTRLTELSVNEAATGAELGVIHLYHQKLQINTEVRLSKVRTS